MKRMKRLFLPLLAAALLLSGCGQTAAETAPAEEQETQEEIYPEVTPLEEVDLEDEAVALAGEPAVSTLLRRRPPVHWCRATARPLSTIPIRRTAM